jgi:hypothetical protein
MTMDVTDLGAVADSAFTDFGTALQGAGVDVGRAWQQVQGHKAELEAAASQTASSIEALQDDQWMDATQKAARIRLLQDVYDSARIASMRGMAEGLAQTRAALTESAKADLAPGEPMARMLLQKEIDMKLSMVRGSYLQTLFEMARDPRLTAEVAAYGPMKLEANNEREVASRLVPGILASVPGMTPKSQAARSALKKLDRAQGTVVAIEQSTAARVARAAKPRPPATGTYKPDTLRPRI